MQALTEGAFIQITKFGLVGLKYELSQPFCQLDNGDRIVEATILKTGEKAEYR